MFTRLKAISLILAGILMVGFSLPAMADSDENSLTGSWRTQSEFGGETGFGLVSFSKDGTVVVTVSTTTFTTGHGAWEKIDARTFIMRTNAFIVDEDGNLSLMVQNTELIELSEDGASYASEATAEISLPDGTPVTSVSIENVGTRISVD